MILLIMTLSEQEWINDIRRKNMNLPNKLTVLRVALIPFFMATLLLYQIPYHMVWALALFAIASITDWFDGKIARKNNLVTTFGKFLDPLGNFGKQIPRRHLGQGSIDFHRRFSSFK